jgi:GDP-4-dehydro-6-deoxy-D-mannose reductase
MKAFVTGATGFVGRYLLAHLEQSGDQVIGPDESLDIVDRDAIHAAVAEARPDVVYHLAALSHVGDSWADSSHVLRVNIEGTANVLDAARASGVSRVLVVGSAEEYGRVAPYEVPIDENTPLKPATPYGVSKLAASFLALQAHVASGLHTIRVRAFSHTGPGQSERFLIPALAHRIAVAENDGVGEITVGNLEPVRDLSDVRDVVRAYRLLMEHGEPGDVYNVCRGEGSSVGDFANALLAHARRRLTLVQDPALVRPVDVPRLVGDPAKLRRATGWSPQFSVEETLGAVLEHERGRVQGS